MGSGESFGDPTALGPEFVGKPAGVVDEGFWKATAVAAADSDEHSLQIGGGTEGMPSTEELTDKVGAAGEEISSEEPAEEVPPLAVVEELSNDEDKAPEEEAGDQPEESVKSTEEESSTSEATAEARRKEDMLSRRIGKLEEALLTPETKKFLNVLGIPTGIALSLFFPTEIPIAVTLLTSRFLSGAIRFVRNASLDKEIATLKGKPWSPLKTIADDLNASIIYEMGKITDVLKVLDDSNIRHNPVGRCFSIAAGAAFGVVMGYVFGESSAANSSRLALVSESFSGAFLAKSASDAAITASGDVRLGYPEKGKELSVMAKLAARSFSAGCSVGAILTLSRFWF